VISAGQPWVQNAVPCQHHCHHRSNVNCVSCAVCCEHVATGHLYRGRLIRGARGLVMEWSQHDPHRSEHWGLMSRTAKSEKTVPHYTPFTRGSKHEANKKQTYSIYMCMTCASCMLPRVNGVLHTHTACLKKNPDTCYIFK